jgi:hypothetical protein
MAPACSFANGDKQTVKIFTDKPAKITVNGNACGETSGSGAPIEVTLERNKEHLVVAQGGGLEARRRFTSTLSPLGILDIIGIFFFLIPGITLITGHAFMLEPDAMHLTLQDQSTVTEKTLDFGEK